MFLYLPIESELYSPYIGPYKTFGLQVLRTDHDHDEKIMLLPDISTDFSFVQNTDSRLLLEKLFSILSDDEKQIVVLHVTGGLKHREIAEILELPLGTLLLKLLFLTVNLKK